MRIIEKINDDDADSRNRILKWLFALIPDKIENKTVIRILEGLRKHQRRKKKDYSFHLEQNNKSFRNHMAEIIRKNGYIEDQNRYTDMYFGEVTMQFSGCEIFAVYNALVNLGRKNDISLPNLISVFEKDGMLLRGGLGTSPVALKEYLETHDFETLFTTKESKFDEVGKKSAGLILTMYNDRRDVSKAVHTVYISKKDGNYTAHNVYCNGTVVGPHSSVIELLKSMNGGNSKGISLIGINRCFHVY